MLFDAHNHLQDERLGGNLSTVLDRAKEAGVERMMSCATGARGDWDRLRAIADCNPGRVFVSLGVHPWFLGSVERSWKARLELALNSGGIGIGEAGLDAHKGGIAPIEDQMTALAWQMDLALERNLPITLHCVGVWDKMFELLRTRPGLCFVFHSYKGSPEMTREFARLGAYFSIGPSAVFEKRKPMTPTLAAVPPDKLLVETDAPDGRIVTNEPSAARQVCSEPSQLVAVCDGAAKILGLAREEIAAKTYENAARFFKAGK